MSSNFNPMHLGSYFFIQYFAIFMQLKKQSQLHYQEHTWKIYFDSRIVGKFLNLQGKKSRFAGKVSRHWRGMLMVWLDSISGSVILFYLTPFLKMASFRVCFCSVFLLGEVFSWKHNFREYLVL
jgi:hypothetical protein